MNALRPFWDLVLRRPPTSDRIPPSAHTGSNLEVRGDVGAGNAFGHRWSLASTLALIGLTLLPLAFSTHGRPRPGGPHAPSFPTSSLVAWRTDGPPPFFGSLALGLFGHPPSVDQADSDLRSIAELGATGVVLPVLWTSRSVESTTIAPFSYGIPQSEYDRATVRIAERAHARGLAFELRPIVRLERIAPGEWRGTLRPEDWPSWWTSYRAFILHHAETAESARAEIYCIGSELGSTEHDRDRWLRLIRDVRRIYHGRVIYSANWDHYESVTFWDHLDGVGLSAYFELSDEPSASQEDLNTAWRAHRDRILAWSRPMGKPLYLTEVGYPAQASAPVHPWDYTASGPPDPAAQARCFRAFTEAWLSPPDLAGVTVWIWDHRKSGIADASYSIEDKPAEAILRGFFHERAGAPRR